MGRQRGYHKNLKDLEMAKKRNHKIMITDHAIKKVPRVEYKYIPESEYDTIRALARQVLQLSKEENNSNEVAITYSMGKAENIKEKENYIGIAFGDEHDVKPESSTIAYHILMSERECVVIVLHNHPSLSAFSLADIQFLLKHKNIRMMVVVTNLGSISYLVKGNHYDHAKAIVLLNEAIALHNRAKGLRQLRKAVNYFMKKCCSVGIAYENQ